MHSWRQLQRRGSSPAPDDSVLLKYEPPALVRPGASATRSRSPQQATADRWLLRPRQAGVRASDIGSGATIGAHPGKIRTCARRWAALGSDATSAKDDA